MEIRVGKFSKEINSTKQINVSSPTTPGFTNIEVQLKEPSSILSPVIRIEDSVYDPEWNYCYIYIWNRFYFLHDANIVPGGIWEVQLGVDVLATWKSYILNSTAYVARSASNYSNFIPDPTWSHTMNIGQTTQEIDIGLNLEIQGCYLLFLAGAAPAGVGAIPSQSVFVLSAPAIYQLVDYMFSNNFYDSLVQGLTDADLGQIEKLNFNPFQYVTKCLWLPFSPSDLSGTNTHIKFGWWTSDVTGKLLTHFEKQLTFTFTCGTYTSWKDRAGDWTKNELYIPGFPSMTLPVDIQGQTLTGKINIDFATGEASLFIFSGDHLILTNTGKLGCEIQLTSLYKDYVQNFSSLGGIVSTGIKAIGKAGLGLGKAISSVISGFEGILMGDTLKDVLSNAGISVEGAVNGMQTAISPTMSSMGANGSRSTIWRQQKAILTTSTYGQLADNHERLGGMCCQTLQLSTLSGYTEVVNPKVDAPCTSGESTMINGFLSGGFYIE